MGAGFGASCAPCQKPEESNHRRYPQIKKRNKKFHGYSLQLMRFALNLRVIEVLQPCQEEVFCFIYIEPIPPPDR